MTLRFLASIRRCVLLMLLVGAHHAMAQGISWEYVDGLYGGNVLSIQQAPNGRLFALLDNMIFSSFDNGANWIEVARQQRLLSLAIDPQGRLFARTTSLVSEGKILRSTDNGAHWTIASGPTGSVRTMTMDPVSGDLIVGTTNRGLIVTTDAGLSWQTLDSTLIVDRIVIDAEGMTYAAGRGRLWRAERASRTTWTLHGEFSSDITALAIDGGGQPIVAADSIYRYDASSGNWQTTSLEFSSRHPITSIVARTASELFALDTTAGRLYRSSDGGESWHAQGSMLGIQAVHLRSGDEVLAATKSGVWRSSDDGRTWEESSRGIIVFDIDLIRGGGAKELFAMSNGIGMFRSSDNATTWRLMPWEAMGNFKVRDLVRSNRGDLLAVLEPSRHLYRSDDDGTHWDTVALGVSVPYQVYRILSRGSLVVAVAYLGHPRNDHVLLRSSDGGATWDRPVMDLAYYQAEPQELAIDSTGVIYASGKSTVVRSRDSGTTWGEIQGLPFIGTEFIRISVTTTGSILVAEEWGANGYRSTDQGLSWVKYHYPWAGIYGGTYVSDRQGRVFMRTAGIGVLMSANGESNWQFANRGLPDSGKARSLGVDYNGSVLVGTSGYGLYRMRAPSSAVRYDATPSATLHARVDVGRLLVSMELPSDADGEIALYDLLGRRVAVLASDHGIAGEYAFDISTLLSGSYLVRGRFGDDVVTQPIMITR